MSKYKAIERTVDMYPNATPSERYRMLLEERQNYSKDAIDAIFKNLTLPVNAENKTNENQAETQN